MYGFNPIENASLKNPPILIHFARYINGVKRIFAFKTLLSFNAIVNELLCLIKAVKCLNAVLMVTIPIKALNDNCVNFHIFKILTAHSLFLPFQELGE